MSIDKESAARKAATKYPTNLVQAIFEYANLSEQQDKTQSLEMIYNLTGEMLSLLPEW